MKTRAADQHELYKKYLDLKSQKIFAIKKAISKFYSVPLEEQDMEFVAWKAFLEVEEKFEPKKGYKTYRSFFIDCLYWKVKDYCIKYSNNKHKVCNLSNSGMKDLEINNYVNDVEEKGLLNKLAIEDYIKTNKNNYKSAIVNLYKRDYSIEQMCVELDISKTKLYRLVGIIKEDLGKILDKQYTNY